MPENYLAIANIPVQEWGSVYSEQEAFNIGTIFCDLNKPFFAEKSVMQSNSPIDLKGNTESKSPEQSERENLITKISQLSFFLDDLMLYLDTHEKDTQAIRLYCEKSKEYEEVRKQFAEKFYPLSKLCLPLCMKESDSEFCWQDGPMPWEGACI